MHNIRVELDLLSKGLNDLPEVAAQLIEFAGDHTIWLFEGEMGAGKTTLIRAVCDAFGVEDNVHSPTFSLVNEYANAEGETFYHFDFYRIKEETEAMDIGAEEYFYSGDRCFIEWSSKIPSLIPERLLKIELEAQEDKTRKIHLIRYE
jgi:tRNA threonylcarbamoyladenosine biosynthesis protein TsaE